MRGCNRLSGKGYSQSQPNKYGQPPSPSEEGGSSIREFVCSLIQQVFTEHVLCAGRAGFTSRLPYKVRCNHTPFKGPTLASWAANACSGCGLGEWRPLPGGKRTFLPQHLITGMSLAVWEFSGSLPSRQVPCTWSKWMCIEACRSVSPPQQWC